MKSTKMTTESRTMAKAQKTVMIPEELYALIQEREESTGVSFTRLTIAALIHHILGDLKPPSNRWMRLAVGLERGDITVPEILLQIAEEDFAKTLKHHKEFDEPSAFRDCSKGKTANSINYGSQMERLKQLQENLIDNPNALKWIVKSWTDWSKNESLDEAKVIKELGSQE